MRNNHHAAFFICSLMLLCLAGSAQAQSGRRAKERTQTPPPVQTAEDEPAKPATPAAKPGTQQVIVAIDEDSSNAGIHLGYSQLVLRGFVERLKKNSTISLKIEKRMDRKAASNLAKAQEEAYVVWLHLDTLLVSSRIDDNDLFVAYVVFTPATGKAKADGRIKVRNSRQRIGIGGVPVGVPLPPTGTSSTQVDAALLDTGRETAERVMHELDPIAAP